MQAASGDRAAPAAPATLATPGVPAACEPVAFHAACEVFESHEDDTAREVATALLEISDTTFADRGRALRSVHAKSHALLRGGLTVPTLPQPFAQGLFAAHFPYSSERFQP